MAVGFLGRAWRRLTAPRAEVISTSEGLDAFLRSGMASETASGIPVTPARAVQAVTVMACVRVLAESIGQIPLMVYRRLPEGGRERAADHPLWALLHDRPNAWQTSVEFREMLQGHLALRGNAYAFINRLADGRVAELLPLHPDRVEVKQDDRWGLSYSVARPGGDRATYRADQILHLRGLSDDGVLGLSPIQQHREAVGLALATQEHGARLFKNGVRLGGTLEVPETLSDEAYARLGNSFTEAYAGLANAHKTPILEGGTKFAKVSMTSEDAQFLETRKFQRNEIASMFRVPPHMVGDLERATNSNIEQQALEFVKYTLGPWLGRWEKRLTADLLPPAERKQFFVEFNVDGLLRGDFKTRTEGYASALQNAWMNVNEVRALQNLNPIVGGDEYVRQMNLAPLGKSGDASGGNNAN